MENNRILCVFNKLKPIENILSKSKTPFFFLNVDDQDKYLTELEEIAKEKFEVYYVYKTNPIKKMCELAAKHGFGAEVVGKNELMLSLKLHKKIIFNGLYKTDEELMLAIKNKDKVTIILDNLDEIRRIKAFAKGEKIRVGVRISFKGAWERFGLTSDELKDLLKLDIVEVIGLHTHNGIEKGPGYYRDILRSFREIINQNNLKNLEFVDIGGAFPTGGYRPYSKIKKNILRYADNGKPFDKLLMPRKRDFEYSDIATFLKGVYDEYKESIMPAAPAAKLYLEPGRLIASPNVYFASKVINIKRESVIVDGGYTNLMPINNEKHIVLNLSTKQDITKLNHARIYGPLPHVSDFLSRYYYGDNVKAGDVVVICDVGAYYHAMASDFIKKKAEFYCLEKNKLTLSR